MFTEIPHTISDWEGGIYFPYIYHKKYWNLPWSWIIEYLDTDTKILIRGKWDTLEEGLAHIDWIIWRTDFDYSLQY